MKKLFLAFLPALLLSATVAAPAVKAQDKMPTIEVTMTMTLTPFNLAYLAYHGYFQSQGISGYGDLMQGFRDGKVTGSKVVQAAVTDKRLPASFLKDDAYAKAVSTELYSLSLFK